MRFAHARGSSIGKVTAPDMIRVEAVYALPEYQYEVQLELEDDACVADALAALAACEGFADLDLTSAPVGIYGREVSRERRLEAGDRLEIYRPLEMDPMTARRQRAQRQARRQARSNLRSPQPAVGLEPRRR